MGIMDNLKRRKNKRKGLKRWKERIINELRKG